MSLYFFKQFQIKRQRVLGSGFALLVFFFLSSPVYAHKVHIFAYVNGDVIKTESRFNGGRPARHCDVAVHNLPGQDIVASGLSDEQGFFEFSKPESGGDLDIVVACGDGHRGSWRLEALEYQSSEANPATHHIHKEPVQTAPQITSPDTAVLRQLIAADMDAKLGPLRRDLARLAERKTSLQDILGGIGYILGLAGLAAYMKYRQRK